MTNLDLGLILTLAFVMYVYFYIIGGTILGLLKWDFSHYFAPLLGYAFFSYLCFGLLYLTTDFWCVLSFFLLLPIGCIFLSKKKKVVFPDPPYFALFLSLIISAYALYILYPKFSAEGISWIRPVFDHRKMVFISSIAHSGVPVVNPFCAFPDKSYYYFLFYVPLSVFKIIFQASAYEIELAGEVLTCILCFPFIVGCVCLLKKKECSWLGVIVCFLFALMNKRIESIFAFKGYFGMDPILNTVLWTPNTFLSASFLIFSLYWIHIKKFEHMYIPALLIAVSLGLSSYIFVVAFGGLALFYLYEFLLSFEKKKIFIKISAFAGCVFLLSLPFLLVQSGANKIGGFPVAFALYDWAKIDSVSQKFIGFWTIFLCAQMPLILLINFKFLKVATFKKYTVFYSAIIASLLISCCLQTTIYQNDLGWRSCFVAIELLTIFAIYYTGTIKNRFLKILVVLASLYFISFPFIDDERKYDIPLTEETISAIQSHVKKDEYYLNHIYREKFPGNLAFSFFSERKSCYQSYQSVRAYGSHDFLDFKFTIKRIFNGSVSMEDIKQAHDLKCSKFIFFQTDKNFKEEEKLMALGLKKIYENSQIKIWE